MESCSLPDTFQKSAIAIPEDFESREEMVKLSVKTNERAVQVGFKPTECFFLFVCFSTFVTGGVSALGSVPSGRRAG